MSETLRLSELELWLDPLARGGPHNMAIDEWLLENSRAPLLRVYRWAGNWGSLGYFGSLAEARHALPGVEWVRRWTGGGIVDHRADWTYTLVVPADCALARLRGGASYALVHAALARVLVREGGDVRLADGGEAGGLCFAHPVEHDLIGASGGKLAGAGQRRGARGLLHQGSVASPCEPDVSRMRAISLANELSGVVREIELDESCLRDRVGELCAAKYGSTAWTTRR